MDNTLDLFFEDGYVEPRAEEKAALITKLQSGDYTLSFSSLSAFAISPAAFIAYKLQEYKTTKAMLMGELVHCLVLEPDEVLNRYHIAPNVSGATAEGKNAWAKLYLHFLNNALDKGGITKEAETAIEAKLAGVTENKQGNLQAPKIDDIIADVKAICGTTIIPHTANEEAKFRARKLLTNRACRHVINQLTYTEKKITFEFCGIKFRGVIDGGGNGIICDLKNMPDATIEKAQYAIWGRRLHWQAFGYNEAMNGGNECYILAVDGSGETSVHWFSERNLMAAERQMKRYCQKFKECITESLFDISVWDMSQDFWLRSEMNEFGINHL